MSGSQRSYAIGNWLIDEPGRSLESFNAANGPAVPSGWL